MKCKFTTTCKECGCIAEISVEKWVRMGKYFCPSCHTEIPSAVYSAIADAINYIAVIPNDTERFHIEISEHKTQESHS